MGINLATFGKTTIGTSAGHPFSSNAAYLCKFTSPAEGGTITKLTAYLNGNYAPPANLIAVIYADNAGVPSTLLATGTEVALPATIGWFDLPITFNFPINTPLWLGFIEQGGVDMYYDAGATNQFAVDNFFSYPSPLDPWNNNAYAPFEMSIYATYEPLGPQWTLTISAGIGGNVSPIGTITGAQGTSTPNILATPATGYAFSKWIADGTTEYAENPISLIINDVLAHTLEAVFIPLATQYTLTVQSEPSGIEFTIT